MTTEEHAPALGRRSFLRLVAAAGAGIALSAHTPYGQWTIYRRRNLFVVASRSDDAALALARTVVAGLARELPEAHARVTRATDPVRIASLLVTGQLDVAIVSRAEAEAMLNGSREYRAVGPTPLRVIVQLGDHALVTTEDLKDRHAYLLARAVDHMQAELPAGGSETEHLDLPEHPGALAYRLGRPLPNVGRADQASAIEP
jgi:hypothetical protein